MKITLALGLVFLSAAAMFRVPTEMWCITTDELNAQGVCRSYGVMESENEGYGNVDVMRCDFDIEWGAPGVTPNCMGNAMQPVYR